MSDQKNHGRFVRLSDYAKEIDNSVEQVKITYQEDCNNHPAPRKRIILTGPASITTAVLIGIIIGMVVAKLL